MVENRDSPTKPVRPIPHYRIEDLVAEMRRLGPKNAPPFEDWSVAEPPWPDWPVSDFHGNLSRPSAK